MNSTWSHSCWYPQGSISKACNSWHVSGEGQMHRIALSLSKLVVEYSSGSWVFADWYLSSGFFCLFVCLTDCFFPFLIGAYSFIPPFFRFHFRPDPASTSWHSCATRSLVPNVHVLMPKQPPALAPAERSRSSLLQGNALRRVQRRDDNLLAWKGTKRVSPG